MTVANDRALGAALVVKLGLGTAAPTVNIAADGLGLTGYSGTNPYRTRTLVNEDHVETQRQGYRQGDITFNLAETQAARRLLWMKSLRRFTLWEYAEGEVDGAPLRKMVGIATITHPAPSQGDRSFTVALAVDGAITSETFSAEEVDEPAPDEDADS